jgi:hypothetical protein
MKAWVIAVLVGASGFGLGGRAADVDVRLAQRASIRSRTSMPSVSINTVRSRVNTNVYYQGVMVQALKSNPLQLFNPLAPARYGYAETNAARDLMTGRIVGVNLFAVTF